MPCDTIQSADVDLGKIDPTILDAAMKALGIDRYSVDAGIVSVYGKRATAELTASIKRTYTKEVVRATAKKMKWGVKEQPDGKLMLVKSSF